MPTPNAHAKLSASSAHRWLNCTAAPTFEEQFENKSSEYAEEGTVAHELCEITGRLKFGDLDKTDFKILHDNVKQNTRYNAEMEKTAGFYADTLFEKSLIYPERPAVFFEVRVSLEKWIPEGFGTCDCCMIGGDTLRIFDYKHGKGVKVESKDNPQMRLYALGALDKFRMIYGNSIKRVITAIIQPRISEEISEEELSVDELLRWGASIVPTAQTAFTGVNAEFHCGDWCRFCNGKAQCKHRAENYFSLSEYADVEPDSDLLSPEDIAYFLKKGAGIVKWYEDLQDYARQTILAGNDLPGWKVVEGRSVRSFTNTDEAFKALTDSGYPEAMLYERKPLTLSQIEKAVGKKQFDAVCGKFVCRPAGKPTLVEASDKRPAYSSAAAELAALNE